MTSLPVLVTVPHGGIDRPVEASSCRLDALEFAIDGDTWARELFNFGKQVAAHLDTGVPRAIVDLNRAPDDLPPDNPDGVVKTVTVDQKTVWQNREGPGDELTRLLIERYHAPWHKRVARLSENPDLRLGIDCHTMLARSPRGPNEARPLICLGNLGGKEDSTESVSAPNDLCMLLLDNLRAQFTNMDVEIEMEPPEIRLNDPFRGGFITRYHSQNGPLSWIQMEFSRALYLPDDFGILPQWSDKSRLTDLQNRMIEALKRTL